MDARITGNVGEILLREGLITPEQLEKANRERVAADKSLARVLVEMGLISEKVKLGILQKKLGCEILSLRNVKIDALLAARVPRGLAFRYLAVPVRLDPDGLLVAMDDPSDLEAVDKLSAIAQVKIKPVLATSEDIGKILAQYPQETSTGVVLVRGVPTGLRVIRELTFWFLLLAPLIALYFVIRYHTHFQTWLVKQDLSIFDISLYLLICWGTWSVVIYYFHDMLFSRLLSTKKPSEDEDEEE